MSEVSAAALGGGQKVRHVRRMKMATYGLLPIVPTEVSYALRCYVPQVGCMLKKMRVVDNEKF